MEVKKIDNLLQELKDVQLSKESMSCINGGLLQPLGISQWSAKTKTGTLTEYYEAVSGITTWVLSTVGVVLPAEIQGTNDMITV